MFHDARFVRWSCLCFLASLFLMHHDWFQRGRWPYPNWILAATAMGIGTVLYPPPWRKGKWRWGDLLHTVALQVLALVWLIVAIVLQPNPFVSLVDMRHFNLPLMLIPAAILYLLFFQLAKWHARLGDRPVASGFHWMSWVFPLVLICNSIRLSSDAYIGFILFELLPMREVVRWGAPALYFVAAFMLGMTWHASLAAAGHPPRVMNPQ